MLVLVLRLFRCGLVSGNWQWLSTVRNLRTVTMTVMTKWWWQSDDDKLVNWNHRWNHKWKHKWNGCDGLVCFHRCCVAIGLDHLVKMLFKLPSSHSTYRRIDLIINKITKMDLDKNWNKMVSTSINTRYNHQPSQR